MRLFVAILLNDVLRSRLTKAQRGLASRMDDVRWTKPEHLHLTAKFIGEVKDRDVPAVCDAVSWAASKTRRFEMSMAGCGCFPERGPVRVVWAGVKEETGALHDCIDTLESELDSLGYPRERKPFSAHITIGRLREDCSDGKYRSFLEKRSLETQTQTVSSMVLMSSALSSWGPTYAIASTAKFGVTPSS